MQGRHMFRCRTLAEASGQGQDNFLLLRLLAASMVIYGHGPAISGGRGWPDLIAWLGWGTYSGELAVDIFFVVSGYMIAGSYLRRGHLFDFLWARALRIYPGYLFCLLVSAVVLGATLTTLPLADYLPSHDTIRYVTKNIELGKGLAWNLPGVFVSNPLSGVVNGSIWTLPAEVRMYLWVAAAGLLGVLARRRWCNLLIAVLFVCGMFAPKYLPLIPLDTFLPLAAYFAAGVLCYVNRESIRFGWWLVAALGALACLLRHSSLYPFAFGLALIAFVFAFAYATPWHGFNRFGDYSYGLYLWGFPAQQVVANHWPGLAAQSNALAAWPLAMVMAILSWHLIEKPALSLKSWPRSLYRRKMAASA